MRSTYLTLAPAGIGIAKCKPPISIPLPRKNSAASSRLVSRRATGAGSGAVGDEAMSAKLVEAHTRREVAAIGPIVGVVERVTGMPLRPCCAQPPQRGQVVRRPIRPRGPHAYVWDGDDPVTRFEGAQAVLD